MKLAFTSIRRTRGAALARSVIRVSENGPAPLLSVASILPFGASAMPKGFGACTFTSTPAGVKSRPFGSTATLTPSITVLVVAGLLPAGAEKRRKPESPPSCSPRCAAAVHAPAVNSAVTMRAVTPVSIRCRAKYSRIACLLESHRVEAPFEHAEKISNVTAAARLQRGPSKLFAFGGRGITAVGRDDEVERIQEGLTIGAQPAKLAHPLAGAGVAARGEPAATRRHVYL